MSDDAKKPEVKNDNKPNEAVMDPVKETPKGEVTPEDLAKRGTEAPEIGEISPQEAQQLQMLRQATAKRKECALKIDQVLKEYNAVLTIDPNSAFGSPQIIVSLR